MNANVRLIWLKDFDNLSLSELELMDSTVMVKLLL